MAREGVPLFVIQRPRMERRTVAAAWRCSIVGTSSTSGAKFPIENRFGAFVRTDYSPREDS
jgi:hypothetical protein